MAEQGFTVERARGIYRGMYLLTGGRFGPVDVVFGGVWVYTPRRGGRSIVANIDHYSFGTTLTVYRAHSPAQGGRAHTLLQAIGCLPYNTEFKAEDYRADRALHVLARFAGTGHTESPEGVIWTKIDEILP